MTYVRTSALTAKELNAFSRLLYTGYLNPHGIKGEGATASVANTYTCSPIEIPFKCQVNKIGILIGLLVNGNLKLGLHSSTALIPDLRIATTASVAVNTLATDDYNFIAPTTTVTINAGLYWVGGICDANYVIATSGVQFRYSQLSSQNTTKWNDSIYNAIYNEAVGSLNVPSPMTPVHQDNFNTLIFALLVTPL